MTTATIERLIRCGFTVEMLPDGTFHVKPPGWKPALVQPVFQYSPKGYAGW